MPYPPLECTCTQACIVVLHGHFTCRRRWTKGYFSTTEADEFLHDLESTGAENNTSKTRFMQVFRNHYNMKRKLELARADNMLILLLQGKLSRIADGAKTGGSIHFPAKPSIFSNRTQLPIFFLFVRVRVRVSPYFVF